MILADTSIWVDHFRSGDEELRRQLLQNAIVIHPFVVGELALGSLPDRAQTLQHLQRLPCLKVAQFAEVMQMIERRALYRRGIGFIDAHLIASILIHPPAKLWTRDKRLRTATEELGIDAKLP
ncbi:MAG TPA: type II toxin-antitoxin system VapC family toxin [Alloacidobacterium sp.]|nr:type II toxin-antitoxin system VapC family toxin [Alloacidobacterium sp.]HZY72495.1 type II toxin-antitoxin system VapC family toxin [Edaphobacter sp.]